MNGQGVKFFSFFQVLLFALTKFFFDVDFFLAGLSIAFKCSVFFWQRNKKSIALISRRDNFVQFLAEANVHSNFFLSNRKKRSFGRRI